MENIKEKLIDFKSRLKDRHMYTIIVTLVLALIILSSVIYSKEKEYKLKAQNAYNLAFYELIDYVENVETYLAKSLISSSSEQGAKTLTHLWREANMASVSLSQIPIDFHELENTTKFLNQVSDYSYSLSRKNIDGQDLKDEDLKNLEELHTYSLDLKATLIQLSTDINSGNISWNELTSDSGGWFSVEASNISQDSFASLEENFHEYAGLIYDGAFSEHIVNSEPVGLTGKNVNQDEAMKIAREFIGEDKIAEISLNMKNENATIISYDFNVILKENDRYLTVAVSEKGGHIVYFDTNKDVESEKMDEEELIELGKEYLKEHGFEHMIETYYLKQSGILTINYAYTQDDIVIYSDLIKIKIAMDDGEILGIETSGYLNNHKQRDIEEVKVSQEKAKEDLNENLEIKSESLVIIPTQWKTEVLCWEFKGSIKDMDFIVYVNADTGKEEDILLIVNTPNGTLTH